MERVVFIIRSESRFSVVCYRNINLNIILWIDEYRIMPYITTGADCECVSFVTCWNHHPNARALILALLISHKLFFYAFWFTLAFSFVFTQVCRASPWGFFLDTVFRKIVANGHALLCLWVKASTVCFICFIDWLNTCRIPRLGCGYSYGGMIVIQAKIFAKCDRVVLFGYTIIRVFSPCNLSFESEACIRG